MELKSAVMWTVIYYEDKVMDSMHYEDLCERMKIIEKARL